MQNYHGLEARYIGGHVVWLRFRDGTVGEIDLQPALQGPVFEPLRDPQVFRNFIIHPEFRTLVWPNGADFAPEFLHDKGIRRWVQVPEAGGRFLRVILLADGETVHNAFFDRGFT